jgi:hypothetical protein
LSAADKKLVSAMHRRDEVVSAVQTVQFSSVAEEKMKEKESAVTEQWH